MDKSTLSNYGWVVIAVLVIAVMIAFATPFGNFVATGVSETTNALTEALGKALGGSTLDIGRLTINGIENNSNGINYDKLETPVPEATETLIINDLVAGEVYKNAMGEYSGSALISKGTGSNAFQYVRVTNLSKTTLNLDSYLNNNIEAKIKFNGTEETVQLQYVNMEGITGWTAPFYNEEGLIFIIKDMNYDIYYSKPVAANDSYCVIVAGNDSDIFEDIPNLEQLTFAGYTMDLTLDFYSLTPINYTFNNSATTNKIILTYSDNSQSTLADIYTTAPSVEYSAEINFDKAATSNNSETITFEFVKGLTEIIYANNLNKTLELVTIEETVGGETKSTTFRVMTALEYGKENGRNDNELFGISIMPTSGVVNEISRTQGLTIEDAFWKVVLADKIYDIKDYHDDLDDCSAQVYASKEEFLEAKGMTMEEFVKTLGFDTYEDLIDAYSKMTVSNPYLLSTFYPNAKKIVFEPYFAGFTNDNSQTSGQKNMKQMGLDKSVWFGFVTGVMPDDIKTYVWIDTNDVIHIAANGPIKTMSNFSYYFAPYVNANSESTTFKNVTEINFNDVLDTTNATNMNYLFKDCSSIKTLDLTSFNMSNVKTAEGMFRGMKSFTLKISSNFNLNGLKTSEIVLPSGSTIQYSGTYAEFKNTVNNKLVFANNTGTIICSDQTVTVAP